MEPQPWAQDLSYSCPPLGLSLSFVWMGSSEITGSDLGRLELSYYSNLGRQNPGAAARRGGAEGLRLPHWEQFCSSLCTGLPYKTEEEKRCLTATDLTRLLPRNLPLIKPLMNCQTSSLHLNMSGIGELTSSQGITHSSRDAPRAGDTGLEAWGTERNKTPRAGLAGTNSFLAFLLLLQLIHSTSTYLGAPVCPACYRSGELAVNLAGKDPVLRS